MADVDLRNCVADHAELSTATNATNSACVAIGSQTKKYRQRVEREERFMLKTHPQPVHSNLPCLPGKLPAIHQAQCKQFPKIKEGVWMRLQCLLTTAWRLKQHDLSISISISCIGTTSRCSGDECTFDAEFEKASPWPIGCLLLQFWLKSRSNWCDGKLSGQILKASPKISTCPVH